jgi:hypothetical protein
MSSKFEITLRTHEQRFSDFSTPTQAAGTVMSWIQLAGSIALLVTASLGMTNVLPGNIVGWSYAGIGAMQFTLTLIKAGLKVDSAKYRCQQLFLGTMDVILSTVLGVMLGMGHLPAYPVSCFIVTIAALPLNNWCCLTCCTSSNKALS